MIDQRYLTLHEELKLPLMWEFMLLVFVYEEQHEFLSRAFDQNFLDFSNTVRCLENVGLVKWHSDQPEDVMLRKKAEDLFKKHVGTRKRVTTAKEVGEWIGSWREIFPEGVNSGGYRYRGDKSSCLTKMIKFVNTYDYSIEQIFQATRDYVERFSLKGYSYMQLAHYFIQKQGVGSTLSAECEGLAEKSNKIIEEGEGYGRSVK